MAAAGRHRTASKRVSTAARAATALALIAVVAGCGGSSLSVGPAGAAGAVTASPYANAATTPTAIPTHSPLVTPTPTPLPNDVAAAPCLAAARGGPYLRSNGSSFTCQGRPVELTGYTFYPAVLGGAKAWHDPNFRSYIDHILDMGAASAQNAIRATDQWDRNARGQTADDPVIWANMDYLVEAARKRGVFVVIDLSAYRWLLMSNGTDATRPEAWTGFIRSVAARYSDASNVAFYSILGEPAPPGDQAQKDSLVAFYSATSQALRDADPNHLITVGGFNHMEDSPQLGWWQAMDGLPTNDIVAFKTYSQHDLDLMPAIAAYSRSIGKPALEEEFGMPQGYGDAAFAGGSSFNGLASGRAPFFESVYSSGRSLGLAGFLFWNMGCQAGRTSYEVNPNTPATWDVVTRNGAVAPASTTQDVTALCS